MDFFYANSVLDIMMNLPGNFGSEFSNIGGDSVYHLYPCNATRYNLTGLCRCIKVSYIFFLVHGFRLCMYVHCQGLEYVLSAYTGSSGTFSIVY